MSFFYFQGYNRVIAFSRPFYFCVCASIVLGLDYAATYWSSNSTITLYTMSVNTIDALNFAKSISRSE